MSTFNSIQQIIQNQCSYNYKSVKNWIYENPTIIKIIAISSLTLGVLTLQPNLPFAIKVSGAAVGFAASMYILFSSFFAIPKKVNLISDLWAQLYQKTQKKLPEFLPIASVLHRFSNIKCPKETAVSIDHKYIHANKVGEGIAERRFVATQAPIDADYETFWKIILNDDSTTIFDLTTKSEQLNLFGTKYYPEKLNETVTYRSISVKVIDMSEGTHTYEIKDSSTKTTKIIKRCHYTAWEDFGTVALPNLQDLVKKLETLSPDKKSLVWVHCRAGVGRTGTLITAIILKEKIARKEITKDNLDDSLMDIVLKLRKQRGPSFVQQEAQLNLLREYGNSLIV